MTKKDYKVIAQALNNVRNIHAGKTREAIERITNELCEKFKKENPRFSEKKFREVVNSIDNTPEQLN